MDEHGVKPRGGHAAIRGWTRMKKKISPVAGYLQSFCGASAKPE
jgi:hypothetical protein